MGDVPLQLCDDRAVAPEFELDLTPVLHGHQPQLLQSGGLSRDRRRLQLSGVGLAPPQVQCVPQHLQALLGPAVLSRRDQACEPFGVDAVAISTDSR